MPEYVSSQEKAALLAQERGLLTEESYQRVRQHALKTGRSILDGAVELELLTPGQVDWLSALAEPCTIAPGYELLDVLGRGGMGIVYLARQEKLDRPVALKVIHLERLNSHNVLGRTQLEARVTAGLRHPHIVAAYDFGMHEGRAFLAMELVEGEDLDSYLNRVGRCDERVAWSIIRQAASALAYAAEQGVVHRDIKPGNMLLTKPIPGVEVGEGVPFVKVVDFGLAFRFQELDATRLTAAGGTLGTPAYMAPEQLKSTDVDQRADIYSLGATAFHLLAGQAPFEDSTPMAVMVAKTTGNQAWREKLPADIAEASRTLILSMTDHHPANRPADYRALLKSIDEVLGKTPSVHPELSATRVLTPSQTHAAVGSAIIATDTVADEAISPTREIPPTTHSAMSKSGILVGTLIGVAAAIGAFLGVRSLVDHFTVEIAKPKVVQRSVEPEYRLTGDVQILFNGTDVPFRRGIRPSGTWRVQQTVDFGNVLVGDEGGSLGYEVAQLLGVGFRRSYQLQFRVVLDKGDVAEVTFDALRDSASGRIPAVRVSAEEVLLGTIHEGTRDFAVREGLQASPPTNREGPKEPRQENLLRIASHQGSYYVQLNGQLVDEIAWQDEATEDPSSSERLEVVTLSVRQGEPMFADMKLTGIQTRQ